MSNLTVTVVTPSYNQAEYLPDTIDSVRRQTHEPTEHVVVDGGSDDGTVDVLASYDDLRWMSEPDDGQADAVNKGVEMTDGDVVGWLNSDDPYVYSDAVETAVEAFEETGADVVYGHALLIDGDNRPLRVMHVPRFDPVKLERYCFLLQPSVFVRRELLEEHPLDTSFSYSLDYDLWLRLREYDWTRVDRVLAADRNHGERKTFDSESRAETVTMREERGFTDRTLFGTRQFADKVDWRLRRLRGLAHMRRLLQARDDAFAIDLERPGIARGARSQVYGRKETLA